jgi:hypothetical protein
MIGFFASVALSDHGRGERSSFWGGFPFVIVPYMTAIYGSLVPVEKTTLYLPADLQARLRDASKRSGRPQAEIVRDAVAAYLTEQPRPWPKSIGAYPDLLKGRTGAEAKRAAREQMAKDADPKAKRGRGAGTR